MPIRIRFWETPSYRLRLWAIGMLTFACVAVVLLHITLEPQSRQNDQRFWAPLDANPLRERLPQGMLAQCESFKIAQKSARPPHARRICEYFNTHAVELAEHDASQFVDLLGEPDGWELSVEQNRKSISYDCEDLRPGEQLVIEWRNAKIMRVTIVAGM